MKFKNAWKHSTRWNTSKKANRYRSDCPLEACSVHFWHSRNHPVGMVNLLDIYPWPLTNFFRQPTNVYTPIITAFKRTVDWGYFHNRLLEAVLPDYRWNARGALLLGLRIKEPAKITQIQRELIEVYENDFSKHNGLKVNSGRILMVFHSIVAQLTQVQRKIYVRRCPGGRPRAWLWRSDWVAGFCWDVKPYLQCFQSRHPLAAFDKLDQFKLFVFDTGLLKHMAGIDNSAILLKTDFFSSKGHWRENYVLQQLRGQFEVERRCYSDKNR